jgi:acetoin utilization protein AcuC
VSEKALFIHSDQLQKYDYPPETPLSTKRTARAREILASMDLLVGNGRSEITPQPATRAELEEFHEKKYLDMLQKASDGVFDEAFIYMGLGTPDCPLFPGMYDYAALACGASLLGADKIIAGEARVAFNPAGGYHHAAPGHASGFCYINDIVLACLRLTAAGKRVMFLDLDAHHCDGVQDAFYRRKDVLVISFHESGATLYPGTGFEHEIGEGPGEGYNVNLPLPVGTYDDAYQGAFMQLIPPLAGAFDPDVIVLELGMDGLAGDPLAHLNLTNNVYADITSLLLKLDKPILATGGGGYHQENTARGWALCWSVLSGAEPEEELYAGLGGVMLQSSEWAGGLRDRALLTHGGQRMAIDEAIQNSIDRIRESVFPIHGITE